MSSPGVGHNSNAIEGRAWRRHAWKKARAELKPARVPIEIVRLRIRRAERLGLSYPQYASVLLGTGRDIVGFLFTVGGLQLRLARELSAPPHVAAKLRGIAAGRLALSPAEEDAEAYRAELEAATGAPFDAAAKAPEPRATHGARRRAIRGFLAGRKLPADAVVMIGDGAEDRASAEAAMLAKFILSEDYFPGPAPRDPPLP